MKISLINVTFNRRDLCVRAFKENMANAGRDVQEIVWCDNGSTDGMAEWVVEFCPDVLILNKTNLGVSKGYNRAFAMCSGDWIMNMGDRNHLPKNWLKIMAEVIEAAPHVDAISMWSGPYAPAKERHMPGSIQRFGGHLCAPAIAFETTLFRRSLLSNCGYWREDLGMYGWNDVEWADRLRARGAPTYVLTEYQVQRAQDIPMEIEVDGKKWDYRAWRDSQIHDGKKAQLMYDLGAAGYPYYSPYA